MKIFKYTLYLLDPLFYSQEGLGGAKTPNYIHATAINHAVAYSLNINPRGQPYIISERNGGRNSPRYERSLISDEFYFTPARLRGNVKYCPEIVKGELDGFVRKGYPGAEVLRASQLFFIPPESEFEGYGICKEEFEIPSTIRLGSFRGKAKLALNEAKFVREKANALTDHPIDPLVCEAIRGIMINMFPYPLVEHAVCKQCIEVREKGERFSRVISFPQGMIGKREEIAVKGDTIIL